MDRVELERRTRQFALRVISFVATLPKGRVGDVIGYQLVKAGTSVGANYREANRAESRNDFIHKICQWSVVSCQLSVFVECAPNCRCN